MRNEERAAMRASEQEETTAVLEIRYPQYRHRAFRFADRRGNLRQLGIIRR